MEDIRIFFITCRWWLFAGIIVACAIGIIYSFIQDAIYQRDPKTKTRAKIITALIVIPIFIIVTYTHSNHNRVEHMNENTLYIAPDPENFSK